MSAVIENNVSNKLLPRIVLIACGSFSPPTPMHLRMFEIARDHFEMQGHSEVIGGIVSPTHDSYGKKGLAAGLHRCAMVKLALQTSNWIRLSDWEVSQQQWSRTKQVLQYHQNFMNNFINSPQNENHGTLPGWLPTDLRQRRQKVQLKLLCGADLLESFAVPGLWSDEDIEDIVAHHGLVVITRSGANPEKFIFDSDVLTKHQNNITLITNWVPNEVSSTMIRRLLGRGQSVKYLIDELVLEYIKTNFLFNYKSKYINLLERNEQTLLKIELLNHNQMQLSSTESSALDNDVQNKAITAAAEHAENEQTEHMDQTDYSIKNIFDSQNAAKVFCCVETDSGSSQLLLKNRTKPGQAVQVISNEQIGSKVERRSEEREVQPKKFKISLPTISYV